MKAGANWNNGAFAGARSTNLNNQPWDVNTNIGARLACENQASKTSRHHGVGRSDRLSDHCSSPWWRNYVGVSPVGEASFFLGQVR